MSDPEDKPAIPSWQRDAQDNNDSETDAPTSSETAATKTAQDHLEVARRFLQDDAVRDESREKKTEFLREKGISDEDTEKLLAELPSAQDEAEAETSTSTTSSSTTSSSSSSSPSQTATSLTIPSDRPPIVTYPEFLASPPSSPPLLTTTSLLTTLSTFLGLATLVHGTSRYLLQPMHDSLTDARIDLHATASSRLEALVTRLEETVSVVPPTSKKLASTTTTTVAGEDADSEADDPTEMFHRDIGTQTSILEDLPPKSSTANTPSPSETQATRLQALISSLSPLNDSFRTQSTDFHDIGTLIDVFRDDLQNMGPLGKSNPIYGHGALNGYSYQLGGQKEPEDEIKKAKDGIRRVKGLLLSTRNFPASTA